MNIKQIKYELQHLISGTSSASYDALIQTVSGYLKSGKRTGPMAEEKHQDKVQERAKLIDFANTHNLWVKNIRHEYFVSSGAEQKVYIKGEQHVVKLNDAVYYASWEDYFHNLLLHNYFFADTAYQLLGFHLMDGVLHAVIQQVYVRADTITLISAITDFMVANGFKNTRRNDYEHLQLGIIIEDLHDENVLTNEGMLYFIDTVFYIVPNKFWS